MLYRYSEVFRTLMMALDVAFVAAAWLGAYALRFHAGLTAPRGVPPLSDYVLALSIVLPLFVLLFRSHGLYSARRLDSALGETGAVIRACATGVLALAAISFFVRSHFDSRLTLLFFAGLAPLSVVVVRGSIRGVLRGLRRRGLNRRYALLVGSGPLAELVVRRIEGRPDTGLELIGAIAEEHGGRRVRSVPVIGRIADLPTILAERRIDHVLIALSRHDSTLFEKVMAELSDSMVDVRIVPDLMQGVVLRSSVGSLDGLPMIGLHETPLSGWGALAKRGFDALAAAVALCLLSPVLGAIAVAVWVSSGRPIFYAQTRMGHDGRVFRMLKFRSMQRDAESQGPGWTRRGDPRRTRLGAFLRRFDLDELPQLWNVLRGEMSLVGPRPERPAFIESFRRELPGYMLRHKVRAGMTGWAQVHGWRGDTSIRERLEHDLHYIQRWSFWLDLRILAMTLFGGRQRRPRKP